MASGEGLNVNVAAVSNRILSGLQRAFGQFLALPLAVVLAFLLLALATYHADVAWSQNHVPDGFAWLGQILGDSGSLATLLSTIASSIITVTSITFSLLLIALQQGSSSLTAQVTDQFLMRRMNQFYFGYFVGLSLFVLFSLTTASSIHRPVFGTTAALLLTSAALCMIVVLIYNTIDQMRPAQIIRTIHSHVLNARTEEAKFLATTRRQTRPNWQEIGTLFSRESGHISTIDIEALKDAVRMIRCGEVEVQLIVPMGCYVAFNDPIARLRTPPGAFVSTAHLSQLKEAVLRSLAFDDERNLAHDPSYGLDQLAVIAWTSVSTAKSNPNPGQAVIQSLRDIISRWFDDGGDVEGDSASILVVDDLAMDEALNALEQLILVSSESMQAQTLREALATLTSLLAAAPERPRARLADIARRALSSLGEHVLTRRLETALDDLAAALAANGHAATGAAVRVATGELGKSLGVLNSRSTRVPSAR